MKKMMLTLLVLVAVMFTGCDDSEVPELQSEAFIEEFRVVNFVSTNKIFLQKLDGSAIRTTAESFVVITNGQIVNGEAFFIAGFGGVRKFERVIVYPKNP